MRCGGSGMHPYRHQKTERVFAALGFLGICFPRLRLLLANATCTKQRPLEHQTYGIPSIFCVPSALGLFTK